MHNWWYVTFWGVSRLLHSLSLPAQDFLSRDYKDYSYELGFVRRNFGIDSNNYGRLMAVGTHRLGFTEKFTGEIHGELLGNQQSVGLGGVFLSPFSGYLVRLPRHEQQ